METQSKKKAISALELKNWYLSLTRVDNYNIETKEALLVRLNTERLKYDVQKRITDAIFLHWRNSMSKIPSWAQEVIVDFLEDLKENKKQQGISE